MKLQNGVIYIQNKLIEGEMCFDARAVIDGFKLGMRTERIDSVIQCLKSVNSSMDLVEKFGDKAKAFLKDDVDYEGFAQSVGGREKITSPTKVFPVEFLTEDFEEEKI